LSPDPLDPGALTAEVARPGCGAVVTFSGTTRDHATDGEGGLRTGITALEYEAYEPMALQRMGAIAASVVERWPAVGAVVIAHRTGTVPVGESSVVVAVSAPHRDEAFTAAREAIDTVKEAVPIWKREHWDGGAGWAVSATPIAGSVHRGPASMSDTGVVRGAAGESGATWET
jgi:molybdopterin synthase catalytic subunit